MTDKDTDLTRLFVQSAEHPADEAFVSGVERRVVRERRLALAGRAALIAGGLLAAAALATPLARGVSAVGLTAGAISTLVSGLADTSFGWIALPAVSASLWLAFRAARRSA